MVKGTETIKGGWTIGTDFEWVYKDANGKLISSIGLIGGSKKKPLALGRGCSRQEDNVLSEGGIPPVQNFTDFIDLIGYTLEECDKIMAPLTPVYNSSHRFDSDQLTHPKALEFGCDPSYNVYTQSMIEIERDPTDTLRSSAFHVHFGHPSVADGEERDFDKLERMIKWFDRLVVLPSVLLDPDKERRALYGQAGEFRLCPWGFECRALGSHFLSDAKLLEFVWDGIIQVIEKADEEIENEEAIITAINTCDVELATQMCEKYGITTKKVLEYA